MRYAVIDEIGVKDLATIKSLVDTPGVSGREFFVAQVIKEALPKAGWQIRTDSIGNLTARKPGEGKKILFIAHMDEVGLIVRRITADGFLKVERLGGFSLHTLPGSALDLWTDDSRLDALVGALPAHLVNGDTISLSIEEMFVDVGASSKEQVLSLGVIVGDALTWKSDLCILPGRRIRGKALDDRLGCFALIKLAALLDENEINADVTLAFVVQEESMLLEAAPVVHNLEPDIVIGVDGTLPFDTPETKEPQCDIFLGQGPCIKLLDAIRGKTAYLPSWDLSKKIIKFVEEQGFSYQPEVVIGLSTALSLVPFMNKGIQTACISLPIRYHHSAVELADLCDLESLIHLLKELLVHDIL
jgi:putative aminopeptidase FrvX